MTIFNSVYKSFEQWGWWQPWVNTLGYRPLTDDYNDYSGNNYNLTSNSTNLTTVDGVKCCDMNNSKCTASMAVTSLPYTMVFWNKSKVSWWNFSLMWQYSGDWGWSGFGGASNNFEVRYWNTTDKDTMVAITVDTNWHMYALTFDTTGCYVYFDGVQTANPKQSLVNSVANTTPFYIWGSYSGSVVWNNYMWAVIIENKVRTAQEIQDYYDQTKADYWIS